MFQRKTWGDSRINRKEKHNTHFQSISFASIHAPGRKKKNTKETVQVYYFATRTITQAPRSSKCESVTLSLEKPPKEKERISSIVHVQCQGNVVDDRSSSHAKALHTPFHDAEKSSRPLRRLKLREARAFSALSPPITFPTRK